MKVPFLRKKRNNSIEQRGDEDEEEAVITHIGDNLVVCTTGKVLTSLIKNEQVFFVNNIADIESESKEDEKIHFVM